MDGSPTVDLPRPPLLQRVTPRQWLAIDIGLALLFLAAGVVTMVEDLAHGSTSTRYWILFSLLVVVATVPVAVRRRAPVFALACTFGASAATTVLGHPLAAVPVIALPLYSLTVTYPRRTSLVALLLVEAGALVALVVSVLLRPGPGDVTSTLLLAAAAWFAGDSVRTRRAYQAGLVGQAEERQRREADQAQRTLVEERLDIARELHDVVAHSLSVIAIQSGVGRLVIDTQPEEARAALEAVERTSRSALDELRRVLGVLRRDGGPELAPAPAIADIGGMVAEVREAGVPVELAVLGTAPELPRGLELSVYRIVQEALTNVAKHAGSAPTRVCIQFRGDAVSVDVANQPPRTELERRRAREAAAEPHPGGHHGIVGMHERAAAFGGTLVAAPLPDGGFAVQARLPIGAAG